MESFDELVALRLQKMTKREALNLAIANMHWAAKKNVDCEAARRLLIVMRDKEPCKEGDMKSQLRIDFAEDLVQRNDLHLHFSALIDFEYPVRCVQQAMDFLLLLIRFCKEGSGKLVLSHGPEWKDEAGLDLMGHLKAKYKKEVYADIKNFLEGVDA